MKHKRWEMARGGVVVLIGEAQQLKAQVASVLPNEIVIVAAATPQAAVDLLEPFTDSRHQEGMILQLADGLSVDSSARRATWRGVELALTPQEFDILATLVAEPGRAVPFNELLERVWGTEGHTDVDILRSAVKRLRRKLAVTGVLIPIEAVRGFGFRMGRH
jgi:DNA-binding response OmpR family regulator